MATLSQEVASMSGWLTRWYRAWWSEPIRIDLALADVMADLEGPGWRSGREKSGGTRS